jgi:hypothetical protein
MAPSSVQTSPSFSQDDLCSDLWILSFFKSPGKTPCILREFSSFSQRQGDVIMTTVPFSQCCNILTIDAKTLRQWLKQSHLTLQAHPTDARIKCLTMEQVQQLAILHHRSLKLDAAPLPQGLFSAESTQERLASLVPLSVPETCQLPPTGLSHADLVKSLLSLQATVTSLQQQVAQLALELLQERTSRLAHRLGTLEAPIEPLHQQDQPVCAPQTTRAQKNQRDVPLKDRPRHPSYGRLRATLPLIEYGAGGIYILICPQQGELLLTPNSPEWFDWLATLSSFRFMGKLGRLSAYRNSGRSSWIAYRRIHSHRHDHSLGNTSDLTINNLEQMAALLQSYMPSL